MSISTNERETNLDQTLLLLLNELEERAVLQFIIDSSDSDFASVHDTTWLELLRRGFLEQLPMNESAMYMMTSTGWRAALQLVWSKNQALIESRLGMIAANLKDRVKGRSVLALVGLAELAEQTEVPFGWVFNAIDCDLYGTTFNRQGAYWVSNGRGTLIEIPTDFGLERLA